MKILGIDPSINNVGLALYDTDTKGLRTTTFHPSKRLGDSIIMIACEIVMHIQNTFLQKGEAITHLVIEYPQWEDSQRGLVAAKQGYMIDLGFLVGYFTNSFKISPFNISIPSVAKWKGQTPKKATEERVKKKLGVKEGLQDHEYDACGLILWYLEKLNPSYFSDRKG
jgi:hypothetical protein